MMHTDWQWTVTVLQWFLFNVGVPEELIANYTGDFNVATDTPNNHQIAIK